MHFRAFVQIVTNYAIRGQDILLHDFPCIRQLKMRAAEGVGPYGDPGQDAPPVTRAERNKIGAGAGVIVIRQANCFS